MLSTTDLASLPNRPPAQDTPDTPSTASIKLRSMPSPSKQPEIVAVQAPPRLSQRPTIHFRGSETDSSPPSVIYESRQSPVRGRDWKRITSFAVLCLANLLCAIDGSIVSLPRPCKVRRFRRSGPARRFCWLPRFANRCGPSWHPCSDRKRCSSSRWHASLPVPALLSWRRIFRSS